MGLEEVKNELKEKATQEREKIRSEAKTEASKILDTAKQKGSTYEEQELVDATKIIDSIERKEITTTMLDIKKKLLQLKKESIDRVFDEALTKVAKDKKNSTYLQKLLSKAKKSMDVSSVRGNSKDKDEFKNLNFKASDMEGGLIAESSDGSILMDFSYSTLVSDLKGKILTDVAQILFENAEKN